jgi:hypothetical protein
MKHYRPDPSRGTACPLRSARPRGIAIVWFAFVLVALSAIVSLGVDWGHVQMIRTQMQGSADDIALGVMDAYLRGGWNSAYAAAAVTPTDNAIDSSALVPTVTITGGSWNASTRTFSPNVYSGTPAVQVGVTCTNANGNAVKLIWGSMIGVNSVDVRVSAVACQSGGESAALSIPSTANLYLSGMPSSTVTSWGDDFTDATPYGVTSIPVVAGQWISFSNASGSTSILPGSVPYAGPDGLSSMPLHHGQNWNSSPNNPGPEYGIADAVIPASAITGLFLTDSAPDASAAPATVDWTLPAVAAQTSFADIGVKQPFMIGDGLSSGGQVQRFRVPAGATRLFLSVWDGVQQNNNGGSVSATIQRKIYPKLVR